MSALNEMKLKLYNALVNRDNGIRRTYHELHDNATDRTGRLVSYAQLLKMNAQYYLQGKRDFHGGGATSAYEEKNLLHLSESASDKKIRLSADDYVRKLEKYDVISFDIFDTLLIRPFSDPTDVFLFVGIEQGTPDFRRIRIEQEFLARQEHKSKYGDNEVTYEEIWDRMERETGASRQGMECELELEEKFSFANPLMKEVFDRLKEMGKTIICISDMYLSQEYIRNLLESKGFYGIEKIYMSGEYKKSKAAGDIYRFVKDDLKDYFPEKGGISVIHVGDNEVSDVEMAKKSGAGFDAVLYPNIHKCGKPFRAFDMSPVVGGAYRGVVNDRIYGGVKRYTPEYEYGYIYGGIFALGYAAFIHDYCSKNGIERILFLSRDGDILKKVYDRLYPADDTDYVYMSRAVAVRLIKDYDRYDFFRRFIFYKVNRKLSLAGILKAMKLESLTEILDKSPVNVSSVQGRSTNVKLRSSDFLTSDNAHVLKDFLIEHWEEVENIYHDEDEAARIYYSKKMEGVSKAAVVDIGWTGSSGIALSCLAEREWDLSCEITGFVAGTNTPYCAQPEAGEVFLQSGKIVPYVFSQSLNRDIMKKHDPNKGYNVFWELLLSSPTRQFTGFEMDEKKIRLTFGDYDANVKGAKRIQKGIMDFVDDYTKAFKDYPFMLNISGRDAAAPMLLAASHKEKYLRAIAGRFEFKIDVN